MRLGAVLRGMSHRRRHRSFAAVAILVTIVPVRSGQAQATVSPAPGPRPAVAAIIDAFHEYRLVAMTLAPWPLGRATLAR